MNLIWHADFPQWKFSLYFVGYCDAARIPKDPAERRTFAMNTPGTVELTYNYGESGYHTGNTTKDPPVKGGFGHIGVTVPGNGIYDACQRFKDMGCEFQKSPNSGGMKGIAFVKDPDGYWIEIIPQGSDWERQDVGGPIEDPVSLPLERSLRARERTAGAHLLACLPPRLLRVKIVVAEAHR